MYSVDDTTEWPVWALPYINVARFRAALDPEPHPWRTAGRAQANVDAASVQGVVGQFVRAAQMKDLAKKLPEGRRKDMAHGAESTIAMLMDDYCGTPPRKWPWPFPGPPPWAMQIAMDLSFIANTLQAGGLRDEINGIAGQILSKTAGVG